MFAAALIVLALLVALAGIALSACVRRPVRVRRRGGGTPDADPVASTR